MEVKKNRFGSQETNQIYQPISPRVLLELE
jgi:hypothetical protein